MTERIPELPTSEQYFAATQEANREIEKLGVKRYFNAVLQGQTTTADEHIIKAVATFGSAIEPIDRATGLYGDSKTVAGLAVVKGALGGYQVARRVHQGLITGGQVHRRLWEMGKEFVGQAQAGDDDDALQQTHEAASYMIDYGERGLALIGPEAEDLLEDWEMKVIEDVTKQRMFRVGAGVVLMTAQEIHLEKLLAQREEDRRADEQRALKELEDGIDWAKDFADIFGEPPKEPDQP